jgi:UDP:flavonoid glycosyltransferase YjiC (YdhE family)
VRLAFSGNPMVGHLMPMFPLMRAAVLAGHDVAMITSAGMTSFVRSEGSAEVTMLPAGPSSDHTMADMLARTGVNPVTRPHPDTIAEFFAGEQVTAAFPEALERGRRWRPDVVVSETMDFVGPAVAGALDLPLVRHTYGPTRPHRLTGALRDVADGVANRLGTVSVAPTVWIDAYPEFLQHEGYPAPTPRIAIRPEVRHSVPGRWTPLADHTPPRATVLVTTGTVFTDPTVQDRLVRSVRGPERDIRLATGRVAPEPHVVGSDGVRRTAFRAMGDLLGGVDVLVTAGGAGTVLAALVEGVPMVIMPLGADHDLNAARAEAAGTALLARTPEAVGTAVARVLAEDGFRLRAMEIATRIRAIPDPAAALDELLTRLDRIGRGALQAQHRH